MSSLKRLWAWWLGQFRKTSRLGKVVWAGAPLLLGCCFCWTALLIVVPEPDVEPTAALAERAAATVEVAATQELDEATAVVEAVEPTQTTVPSRTAVPTRTAAPTETEEPATPTPRPSATPRPTLTPAPSATTVPPTATRVPPTAAPPTATNAPLPTAVPPTAIPPTVVPPTAVPPTAVPQPTATLPTATGQLVIANVNKRDEFVDIQNIGGTEVVLDGWTLRSEKGPQDCPLRGVLGAGQSLRIWAMSEDAGQGGFNCQFGKEIWNNSEPDAAVLINPEGAEVSRR